MSEVCSGEQTFAQLITGLRQARGWSLQRWEYFCLGAIPYWPFCWSAHSERSHKGTLESCALRMRVHPRLMLLGVRLNTEVGGFPAVRELAACWNTRLTYTDTSLRPHKHLFAARKSLLGTKTTAGSFWVLHVHFNQERICVKISLTGRKTPCYWLTSGRD